VRWNYLSPTSLHAVDEIIRSLLLTAAISVAAMEMPTTARATGKEASAEFSNEVPSKYNLDGIEDDAADPNDGHTKQDHRNMVRVGKRQELMRNFRPLSALSFTVLLQATWEFLLM
jgi:hypothetical protein